MSGVRTKVEMMLKAAEIILTETKPIAMSWQSGRYCEGKLSYKRGSEYSDEVKVALWSRMNIKRFQYKVDDIGQEVRSTLRKWVWMKVRSRML